MIFKGLLPEPQKRFDSFCRFANKQLLHPRDWQRFYVFVWKMRLYPGRQPTEDDMADMLMAGGFDRERAEKLASVYLHLVDFKYSRSIG